MFSVSVSEEVFVFLINCVSSQLRKMVCSGPLFGSAGRGSGSRVAEEIRNAIVKE